MPRSDNLFTARRSLSEICEVPDKFISVYSLEKHVWAESNSVEARQKRKPELKTIEEFQLDPVRPFLTDVFRNMAAPYKPERRDNPIGQGYWIQAEFGSGKSHLLCFLAAAALGRNEVWDIIRQKEDEAGRGKRESLYRFWEEGLESKSGKGSKGIFVLVRTLVGAGSGTVGMQSKGRRLSEYIIDAAKDQLQHELGKNLSLYPVELLADRFISEDLERYRKDLSKFLNDPAFFEEDEFEDVNDFIATIQQDQTPEYKRSCGNKLWRFYTEYLKVQPQIAAESEDILKNMVETILAEGYSGVLLVLDELSLFMKNRDEDQRTEDEKTLVVLANRLAKVHNLPVWTVCAAQQAIESKMGVKNIIADDRLKLVKLLEEDKDYYDIVLSRVRTIKDDKGIGSYYLHYKRGFTWPNSIGEADFRHFFPFHKPAIEVLRAITYELTTARSAIHFMHQTLKHQIKQEGRELIRLWELFDETMEYEEDPSGVHSGLVNIKTKKETDYRAYEACKRQIDGLTKGYLKVHRDKALKVVQTLFLYHIAKTRQQGITPEDVANSVLIERDGDANPEENIQHYETLADNLRKELRQIAQNFDEGKRPRYRFDPVFTGVDPREEFQKARDAAEGNAAILKEAWNHLLALDEWPVRTRQMTIDLSNGVKSIFRDVSPFIAPWENSHTSRSGDTTLEITWQGRQVFGRIGMRDLSRIAAEKQALAPIDSDQSDLDFAVYIGLKPVKNAVIADLLEYQKDPRITLWCPDELTPEERDRLVDFAAYRKLVTEWQGKDSEDAVAVINWVANSLQTDLAKIVKIVDTSYARGSMDSLHSRQMDFKVAGEITSIVGPIVDRILTATYESRDITFEPPFVLRKEEVVKVINGLVKTGHIPKGIKPNQNTSAAQNFGYGLRILRKGDERTLDISDNSLTSALWDFIDEKLVDDNQSMKIETLYKNFMGIGGPKDFGLTKRLVQLYLLCHVQGGKVRVVVGPKSGLSSSLIDYSNLAEIDFSAKVLDSIVEVQKVAKPENWEILRPYAEKLLSKDIPSTHDDTAISGYRAELRQLFAKQKEEVVRTASRTRALFEILKLQNPYETEVSQAVALYSHDIESGDDINMVLFALREAYGYQAFDKNAASQAEIDDLSNRLKNYHALGKLLQYEQELKTAQQYCNIELPETPELKAARDSIAAVKRKLKRIDKYIDSEVKLKNDVIGSQPPAPGETATISAMIKEYSEAYASIHDSVISAMDELRKELRAVLDGGELLLLKQMEEINALKPSDYSDVVASIQKTADALFVCENPSRSSVTDQLAASPLHECELDISSVEQMIESSTTAVDDMKQHISEILKKKASILLNSGIRQRLEQGKSEPLIEGLLECHDTDAVLDYLRRSLGDKGTLCKLANRYLKKIIVRTIALEDFRPSKTSIEREQVGDLTREFEQFIESHFKDLDEDSLLIVKFE